MPIFGGGSGGNSSPSIIEYNFSEGREINLSSTPQKIIEAVEPKIQRSFWVYFTNPASLAGTQDMAGAIDLPGKTCFEFSDNGGKASDWWARATLETGSTAKILIKTNQKINQQEENQPTLKMSTFGWEPSPSPGFSLAVAYNGNGSHPNPLGIEIINNTNISATLFSLSQVPADIWEFENYTSPNFLYLSGNGMYFYEWDWQAFPYISILNIIGAYDAMELIEMNFEGLSIKLGAPILI